MSSLIASTTDLVIVRCWCGVQHAVPETLRQEQLREFNDGRKPIGIYCPLGHSHVPVGQTECDRLQRELDAKVARTDQLRASLRDTQASLSATKGVVTRIKKRVGHGVCPCCQRNFANLRRHMEKKHPAYSEAPDGGR